MLGGHVPLPVPAGKASLGLGARRARLASEGGGLAVPVPSTAELRLLSCRIRFPIQVNHLPRETLLSVTLFAVPVPPPGSSSDANKQRRVPEALGWVTTPLFNFRQYVGHPAMAGTARGCDGIPGVGQEGLQPLGSPWGQHHCSSATFLAP